MIAQNLDLIHLYHGLAWIVTMTFVQGPKGQRTEFKPVFAAMGAFAMAQMALGLADLRPSWNPAMAATLLYLICSALLVEALRRETSLSVLRSRWLHLWSPLAMTGVALLPFGPLEGKALCLGLIPPLLAYNLMVLRGPNTLFAALYGAVLLVTVLAPAAWRPPLEAAAMIAAFAAPVLAYQRIRKLDALSAAVGLGALASLAGAAASTWLYGLNAPQSRLPFLASGMAICLVLALVLRFRLSLVVGSEDLKTSETRFRDIAEASAEWLWETDGNDRIVWSNEQVRGLLGYEAEELVGKKPEDLLDPVSKEWYRESMLAVSQLRLARNRLELAFLRKDGTPVEVQSSFISRFNLNGQRILTRGANADMSQRRKVEQALRAALGEAKRSESRLKLNIEKLPMAYVLWDTNFSATEWNPAAERIFGWTAREALGRSAFDLMVPPTIKSFIKEIWSALREGKEYGNHSLNENRTKDGRIIMCEWFNTPLHDPATGAFTGCLSMVLDITERQQKEIEVRNQKDLLQSLINALPYPVFFTDPQGCYLGCNTAWEAFFGKTHREIKGKTLYETSPMGLAAQHRKVDRALFSTGVTQSYEMETRRQDGAVRRLFYTKALYKNAEGEVAGIIGSAMDVTEQRAADDQRHAMEAQLLHTSKMESVGRLAAGIAHEINTPVQFIGDNLRFVKDSVGQMLGLLEGARTCLASPEEEARARTLKAYDQAGLDFLAAELPQALSQSLEGVDRISAIVKAMKEFSHPDQGVKAPADLNRAVQTAMVVAKNEWKYVADSSIELDPKLPPVPCLSGEINQVLLNLIVNAAHAIEAAHKPEGAKGMITLRTRRDGDWAEIQIQDNGSGISEENKGRVFDPFFTTKEVGKGTGQGLSMAWHTVVEKHGGTLTLESQLGRGTTFFLRLPINPKDQAAAA